MLPFNCAVVAVKEMWLTHEVRKSFAIAWIVVSAGILVVFFALLLLPPNLMLNLAPHCQLKAQFNRECPMCGMTRAFVMISRGNFSAAVRANRGSLFLWVVFVANEAAILVFFRKHLWRIPARLVTKAIRRDSHTTDLEKGGVRCKS
ncbi:DUF2752 domain-containing protein [Candidatus Sumerlaeota bacterium]|nr:DUF2752 domain-containing protein [Candidatus Sumerlaeota bacterium]